MAIEIQEQMAHPSLSNTDLAFERTMLAHERTLMAWVRTAVSLISFGFTLYKFFQEWRKTEQPVQSIFTPRIVGMIMILFGLLGLLFAEIQHHNAVKRLRKEFPMAQRSLSSVLAILILIFGLVLFLAALFRQ
jgi:putative membrane protein